MHIANPDFSQNGAIWENGWTGLLLTPPPSSPLPTPSPRPYPGAGDLRNCSPFLPYNLSCVVFVSPLFMDVVMVSFAPLHFFSFYHCGDKRGLR